MQPWLGMYTHGRGPLVIGPPAVRDALLVDGGATTAFAKKRSKVSSATLGGSSVWVLGGDARPTRVWCFGPECVVLVRVKKYADPRTVLPKAIEFHPGWAPADAYKPVRGRFPITGDSVILFDSMGRLRNDPGPRADDAVYPFEVMGGTWRAEWQPVTYERVEFEVIRLVREVHEPVIEAPCERPADPDPLVVTDAIAQAATRLEFVSTHGGPVLMMPVAHQARWHGVYDESGAYVFEKEPTDYDRACGSGDPVAPIACGPSQAWVLPCPDATAFHPLDDGGLLVRWIGADNPETLLAGALLAPETLWSDTGHVLESEGAFLLMDAVDDGRDIEFPHTTFPLAPGRYAVWSMREFDGEVLWDGASHELMVTAIGLRRLKDP